MYSNARERDMFTIINPWNLESPNSFLSEDSVSIFSNRRYPALTREPSTVPDTKPVSFQSRN